MLLVSLGLLPVGCNYLKSGRISVSGDVEYNQELYERIKSVQGSFSWGSAAVVGETVGRHCACNTLFSVC